MKQSWVEDPCWDLENTEGFEEHKEELKAFRLENEIEWQLALEDKRLKRASLVREQTGVVDANIVSALHTWGEIEGRVSSLDCMIHEFEIRDELVYAQLMQAQVRATLLMAAQMERIADSLDKMTRAR